MYLKRIEIVWLILILACLGALMRYQAKPGKQAEPPNLWPNGSPMEPGADHTLLLFIHPGCPCTRASLRQLERLTSQDWPGLRTYAIFSTPSGVEPDFHETDLWRMADTIPRVTTHLDREGRLSREFGCFTSGQALLYDGNRRLQFAGGVTDSRGHEGDSVGLESIKRQLMRDKGRPVAEVYGCPLFSEGETFCHR